VAAHPLFPARKGYVTGIVAVSAQRFAAGGIDEDEYHGRLEAPRAGACCG